MIFASENWQLLQLVDSALFIERQLKFYSGFNLIRLISVWALLMNHITERYYMLNALSSFVSLHVLELSSFAHERKMTI